VSADVLFIRGFAIAISFTRRREPSARSEEMIKAPDVTAVYVVLAFLATLAILRRYLFAPLSAILDEREREATSASKVLADSLAELEKTVARAEAELAHARGEALAIREKLRMEGRAHFERRLEETRGSAEQSIEKASGEIGAASASAAAALPKSARELARTLAEKILGRKIAA
jgi:F-type H+-transporting ATPase subunit b